MASCGSHDGMDGIAGGGREVIALEQAIGLCVTEDRPNGFSPP